MSELKWHWSDKNCSLTNHSICPFVFVNGRRVAGVHVLGLFVDQHLSLSLWWQWRLSSRSCLLIFLFPCWRWCCEMRFGSVKCYCVQSCVLFCFTAVSSFLSNEYFLAIKCNSHPLTRFASVLRDYLYGPVT